MNVVCADCGTPHPRGTRCPNCPPPQRDTHTEDALRGNRHQRGYGNTWERLSRRARTLQPWCSDCGTTDNLTVDHSPQAWDRHANGQPIRLDDVDVVCQACNNRRGPARGPKARQHATTTTHRQAIDQQTQGGRPPTTP